jgi:hypothetical protein
MGAGPVVHLGAWEKKKREAMHAHLGERAELAAAVRNASAHVGVAIETSYG